LRCELGLNDQPPPLPGTERALIAKFGNLMEGIGSDIIFQPRDPRTVPYLRDVYWLGPDCGRPSSPSTPRH